MDDTPTVEYMSANGIKCSGYTPENGVMKLYLVDTTIDEVKQVDWTSLDMQTSQGTTFLSSTNYHLESIQVNMADNTITAILRNVDDPTYAKVIEVEKATADQQEQLDIMGDAVDAIIQAIVGE